ncbi:MAG: RcnB family protein [Sphingomonadales bacterium]|nr:RcnB family protein [Sphingomonadales bacterium]
MRKMILAALAATVLTPVAANAQDWRRDRAEMRHDQREMQRDRHELREDRREAREDWRSYRNAHRDAFRMGPYAGPRGWTYRPVVTGYLFAPTFYAQRFWIANPQAYRLPPAGPGLRWVRYGNDVVLVNLRTGRVVQVFNEFFW